VELREKLAALSPEDFVAEVTGLAPEHPLFPQLVEVVRA
jgi:mannitol-1-phosphate 5-dehydrogenase